MYQLIYTRNNNLCSILFRIKALLNSMHHTLCPQQHNNNLSINVCTTQNDTHVYSLCFRLYCVQNLLFSTNHFDKTREQTTTSEIFQLFQHPFYGESSGYEWITQFGRQQWFFPPAIDCNTFERLGAEIRDSRDMLSALSLVQRCFNGDLLDATTFGGSMTFLTTI